MEWMRRTRMFTDIRSRVVDKLLASGEPWVVYNTLLDLTGSDPAGVEAKAAYRQMQADPRVGSLIEALETWPPDKPLAKAYDPKDSIWKLGILADFGLRR